MAIDKSVVVELDTNLERYGRFAVWVSLLKTLIKSSGPSFQYMLDDKMFTNGLIPIGNLLEGLPVGDVGVLYEYSVAKEDREERKGKGQFFTPDDVAQFMVTKTEHFPTGATWYDPCSGVGNLSWHLTNAQPDPEDFFVHRLRLGDVDSLALFIARVIFTLSFQKNQSELFFDVEENFIVSDFLTTKKRALSDTLPLHGTRKAHEVGGDDEESGGEGSGFIIVNPPYLATKPDDRFATASCGDMYAFFLEKVVHNSDGFVSITPQSFTNAAKFKPLRKLLLDSELDLTIYTFDNVPGNIFKGFKYGSTNSNTTNSVRAAITVATPRNTNTPTTRNSEDTNPTRGAVKGSGCTERAGRVTQLVRWRGEERNELFTHVNEFVSTAPLTEEFFPKLGKRYEKLYAQTQTMPTLNTLLAPDPTPFALHIPSAPRYFISALKTPVKRTSIRTLYFPNEDNLNRAYLLLNSSLTYWWWRVRDGGMTLSKNTLHTVPLPEFAVEKTLIQSLEHSETASRVYKKNAGKVQENVKHPLSLVEKINKHIIPQHAHALLLAHNNSDIAAVSRTSG